jgi:uncharacterized protein with NRDE domain
VGWQGWLGTVIVFEAFGSRIQFATYSADEGRVVTDQPHPASVGTWIATTRWGLIACLRGARSDNNNNNLSFCMQP